MYRPRTARLPAWWSAALLATAACRTYEPAPVDLRAHAAEFEARLPDAEAVHAFAARVAAAADTGGGANAEPGPGDAIDLPTARRVALWFNADLREQRARSGVAAAVAANAGRLPDPALDTNVERILRSAAHPWLVAGSLALSVPLSGRPARERELADSEHARARTEVLLAEARVLDDLDRAWVQQSAAALRVDLLRELQQQLQDLQAIADRLVLAHELTAIGARTFALERLARAAELVRAEADLAAANARRNELLGVPPDRDLPCAPALGVALRAMPGGDRSGWLAEGRATALRHCDHDAAERELALAIARQWPDLELAPGYGEEDALPRALLGFRLPLPVFDGNAVGIARAEAARTAADAALRAEAERALHALARADRRLAAARAERELLQEQLVPLAAQQLADGRRLAALGTLDPLLLLDGLSRAHEARAALLAATVAEALAAVDHNELFWPEVPPSAVPTADEDSR